MDVTEFNEITSNIMNNLDNQGKVSNFLADLTKGYSEAQAETVKAQEEIERLKQDNQELRDNNQKLFLRVTVPEPPRKPQDEPEDFSIDSLFEKGRLNLEG